MNFHPARALLLAAVCIGVPLAAQDAGPGTGGLVRLAQEQRYLGQWQRVLVIGAHPDDEDTELITILSRGEGIETAYLSLTRGEGGQNLIGGELGPALGIVRSEELLAARRVDGAAQFFTRAYDFGFSKSPEETLRIWPRDSVLKDMVRVVRRFRPHVIVSVWSGTPRDGHGHHQASGLLSREVFTAAGDATRFPELARAEGLAPWQPAKLYRRWGVAVDEGLTLDGGRLDPAVGQSLHQIAMRSRSRHRSQDMGQLEEPGPSSTSIALLATAPSVPTGPDTSLFAGVRPSSTERPSPRSEAVRLMRARVISDAYVEDDELIPGQAIALHVIAWNAGSDTVRVERVSLGVADGLVRTGTDDCPVGVTLPPRGIVRCTIPMQVASDAALSQPYYLRRPLVSGAYQLAGDPMTWGLPFAPSRSVQLVWRLADGDTAVAAVPILARALDQGLGEVRRPVSIVPRVMVDLQPGRALWPAGAGVRRLAVALEHAGRDAIEATVHLRVPAGWTAPAPQTVRLLQEGERRTITFEVTVPRGALGTVLLRAEAVVGPDTLRHGVRRIDYPHIAPHVLFHAAEAEITIAPVRLPTDRRIGYVRGAADAIPEALRDAGVAFRMLDAAALERTNLDTFDVLVIGPRAYEIDEAVRRAHPRLLRFAERGGTLVIQYQQYQFVSGGYAPLPFTIARPHDRVTDETAAVSFLDPRHPLLTGPNVLTAADFTGWVQELGLYFAGTWDAAWTPLLAMADPNEALKQGSLLVGRLGRGQVIYTGLAFFRQLPAAVPGAWRLFANLLAAGRAR